MSKFFKVFAVVCAFSAASASADPLMQYDYFDAAYQWTRIDQSGVDNVNGLDTKASYSPVEHLAIEAGYNYGNTDVLGRNLGLHTFSYGLAGWLDLCDDLHLLGRVGGLHQDLNFTPKLGDDAEDGVYAGTQVRMLLTDTFEADLDVTYSHLGGGGATWVYGATGLYTIAENVALKVGTSINNDEDVVVLGGVRLAM